VKEEKVMRKDWAKFKIETVKASSFEDCLKLFDSNCPRYFLPEERSDFLEFLEKFSSNYLIVRDPTGRAVASGGIAANSPIEASLCWGMVDQSLHKQRLGELLLTARLLIAAEIKEWESVVSNTTQLTEGFFRKYGFLTEKVVENHWGPGLHWYAMRLELNEKNRANIRSHFGAKS
jgi:hypothetical protein